MSDLLEMGVNYLIGIIANGLEVMKVNGVLKSLIVDGILNGTDNIKGIGDVEPASRGYVTMYCPNSKYYGKCLKYKISNLNIGGDECGN